MISEKKMQAYRQSFANAKLTGTNIYRGSTNNNRLINAYIRAGELLDHSVMVYGDDSEGGSRELYVREQCQIIIDELTEVLKK